MLQQYILSLTLLQPRVKRRKREIKLYKHNSDNQNYNFLFELKVMIDNNYSKKSFQKIDAGQFRAKNGNMRMKEKKYRNNAIFDILLRCIIMI